MGSRALKSGSDLKAIWARRREGFETAFSRTTMSHAGAFVAMAAALMGLTPNHLTLLSCLTGVSAFVTAFFLPTDQPTASVLALFTAGMFAFVLDCADGILARGTGQITRFGGFFDHTLDAITQTCGLAAIFVFSYRSGLASGNTEFAHAALIIGFLFLLIREARNFAVHLYIASFPQKPAKGHSPIWVAVAAETIKSIPTYQFSMLAILAHIASPAACYSLFIVQTMVLFASFVRCIGRARRQDCDTP